MLNPIDYQSRHVSRSWLNDGLPSWAAGGCFGLIITFPTAVALVLLPNVSDGRWLFPLPWIFYDPNAFFPQLELIFVGLAQFPIEGMLFGLALQLRARLRRLAWLVPAVHIVLAIAAA